MREIIFIFTVFISFSSVIYAKPQASTAFYYATEPPLDLLAAYEQVILEPENIKPSELAYLKQRGVTVYAYLSIGEVGASRSWFKQIKKAWKLGVNSDWNSAVLDMSDLAWHDYLLKQRMKHLWQQGYRGFFLDTMDSYQLYAKTAEQRAKQEQGMVHLIQAMHEHYPGVHLLFNRGFEVIDHVAELSDGMAVESLYAGWNAAKSRYQPVKEEDRAWLLNKLKNIHDKHDLPIVVIDYLPPERRTEANEVAKKIKDLGYIPWVSTPELDYMGVGSRQLVPRKVLFLYDGSTTRLRYTEIHQFLAMPLEYLGYIPEYWNIANGLPRYTLKGRYAGVASWFNRKNPAQEDAFADFVLQQLKQKVPLAILGDYTLQNRVAINRALAVQVKTGDVKRPFKLELLSESMGYEVPVVLHSIDIPQVQTITGKPWLQIKDQEGVLSTPVFISDWGGMALDPYVLETIPALGEDGEYARWNIDPFSFLQQALKLTEIPVPDNSTENGNRLLTIHIDGDGFYNKTEVRKGSYSSELIRDDFLKPGALPHTVSIIEGEIGAAGLKPELSPKMEKIARTIFQLDNVEIASHSYSHPFDWFSASTEPKDVSMDEIKPDDEIKRVFKSEEGHYHLPIPGYSYSAKREIQGSIDYINQVLAPKNKKTKVFLWSGDCLPNKEALALTFKAQVANLNGGDTVIRNGLNSLTAISSMGIVRGPYFQPYAPIENENVYTNDWLGPYYGYQRVIETFLLTDKPRRFKPLSIYYHFYSGDRIASVRALHRVYNWAQQQETLPLWISEYTPRLFAFRRAAFEKLDDGWRIYGAEGMRTLRLPADAQVPDMQKSQGVVGMRRLAQGLYIALDGTSVISLQGTQSKKFPYLQQANARVSQWQKQDNGIKFQLYGHQNIKFTLADMSANCRLYDAKKHAIKALSQQGQAQSFVLQTHETGLMQVLCE